MSPALMIFLCWAVIGRSSVLCRADLMCDNLYAASNGMVERAIQPIKALLHKAFEEGADPFLAILYYNVTPKPGFPSRVDLLMRRRLRTTLSALLT
ncbi:hypothetical protein QE152_g37590 [Popillia japonica]|uniref:Uncharacterized protein n=1 Tax=Popillia japonica TaxID=7064 RepID=A0AAW1IAC8_POPJA